MRLHVAQVLRMLPPSGEDLDLEDLSEPSFMVTSDISKQNDERRSPDLTVS
jgi:hypothetical protein